MKCWFSTLALAAGLCCYAQEGEKKAGHEANQAHAEEEDGGLEIWKWANFLILAGGLGYLIGKNAGPFLAARSAGIRKDMEESARRRQEAEATAADVDRRLSTLESQIAALRAEAEKEMAAGANRIARQTEEDIAKVKAHAEAEIAIAGKGARAELKRYSGELAVGLAEQKIRARMTPNTQDGLVESFARDLK